MASRNVLTDQSPPELGDLAGREYLRRIGQLYAGHPLVLRVIAEDIKACGANVQRYWQQGQFAELEAHCPAQLSRRKFQIEVKHRVKAALARLPDDALQLLCRSAVYRRPVPESFWFAMLPDRSSAQLQAAMNLLQSRSLAEEEWEAGVWWGNDGAIPLRQHNLIRGVAYELLKADDAVWRSAERSAAEMWVNQYEAVAEAENLEQVRGSLEAFNHFCEIAAWSEAKAILFDQNVGLQLQTWGHYQEMILLHSRLGNHLNPSDEVGRRKSLGNAHLFLSQYKQAIDYYQQSLELAREIGDRQGEGNALGNLGLASYRLGNYAEAIESHQQALVISREIGDRQGEGTDLGSLGNAYFSLGNYAEAIEFYQQHLAIAREIGDRQGEGSALGNLGSAYSSLGNYAEAIEFHQQDLAIAREIGDRRGEGIDLGNLGDAYCALGNYAKAVELQNQKLTIACEIKDQASESYALSGLGEALIKLEQYAEAEAALQQGLNLCQQTGDRSLEAEISKQFAELHHKTGAIDLAKEERERSLEIARELGTRGTEAKALKGLAEIYQTSGAVERALECCEQALALAIELGIPLAEECRKLQEELNQGAR